MAYLAVGVVVVGLIGLLNLVFTLGVVRRMREYEQLLAGQGAGSDQIVLPAGATVGEFEATTTTGERVALSSMSGATLVAFSSVQCGPCRQALPKLAALATEWEGGRGRVLVVVVGGGSQSSEFVEQLEPVARVVVEPEHGPLAGVFAVRGFPAYCVVGDGGAVLASGYSLDQVMERVPA